MRYTPNGNAEREWQENEENETKSHIDPII